MPGNRTARLIPPPNFGKRPAGPGWSRRLPALGLAVLLAATPACVHQAWRKPASVGVPPSESQTWTPPAEVQQDRGLPLPAVPPEPETIPAGKVWNLVSLVDYALRNNPRTRLSWLAAQAAEDSFNSENGAYYPQIGLNVPAEWSYGSPNGPDQHWQVAVGPQVSLSYLLLDGGGRAASSEEAGYNLVAANWNHNAAIQNVAFLIIQSYFLYQESRAIVQAEELAVKEARTVLEAANERHRAGVATIADVLQAEAALSQAELALQTTNGHLKTLQGVLATAVGLPANSPLEIPAVPMELPADHADRDVNQLIQEAIAQRPEIEAARAQIRGAEAHVRAIRSQGRPTLSLFGDGGAFYNTYWENLLDGYSIGVSLQFPLFTGYSHTFNVKRAERQQEQAVGELRQLEQAVALDVWTAYYALETATLKLKTTEDLLRSATQSYEVALGRYQSGVGDIIDTVTAQRNLEDARAQKVRAKADWFLSMAQLIRAVGQLDEESGRLVPGPVNDPGLKPAVNQ